MIEQLLEDVVLLLEDVVLRLDKILFALEYAYFLLKIGLACLGIYGLYRVFKYLVGFNRVN